jgi:hypothetical protein
MRRHTNNPRILWIDPEVVDSIPDEFCADTIMALADVSSATAQHRLRNYAARGLIKVTTVNLCRKFYRFQEGVTQDQRLNLFATPHPDQVRKILSMLPEQFETRHIWPKLRCRDDPDAASQCIVRMRRLGLVEPVGIVRANTGLYRKLPQQ